MRCDKVLMFICDGMPDRPVRDHDMKTPLQVAKTPGMDRLAKEGAVGVIHVIAPGVVPGSDTAHLALFGYNPHEYYSGRGPFEAAGVGIDCLPGDIAFRCNFATVDNKMRVIDRRAGRIKEGTAQIAESLDGMKIDDVEIIFKEATEHRAVLILRGNNLDPRVTDVDPHDESMAFRECHALVPEAKLTAKVVNKFVKEAYGILMKNPVNLERASKGLPVANMILPRGAGALREIEKFRERFDLRPAGIAGVSLIRGVFRILGFDLLEAKGVTGGLDTNMSAKGEAAIKALEDYDLVAMNIKAPDIAGHDGDFSLKVEIIERIDAVVNDILNDLPDDVLFALLSDHSTPISLKNHSADPVCIAIRGNGVRTDGVKRFDETSCAKGILSNLRGTDIVPYLLGVMGRAEKFGA